MSTPRWDAARCSPSICRRAPAGPSLSRASINHPDSESGWLMLEGTACGGSSMELTVKRSCCLGKHE